MTFTEPPEPALSVIHVLGPGGRLMERVAAREVPGNPLGLQVPIAPLVDGVYTVTWRAVSALDGHTTSGTFQFRVGTPAGAVSVGQPAETTAGPSMIYVISRVLLYAGLIGLMGIALARAMAWPLPVDSIRWLWRLWMTAGVGVVLLAAGQTSDAGVGMDRLMATPLGRGLWWRAVPLAAAGLLIAISGGIRFRRGAGAVLCGLTGAAMLAQVLGGHAAAGSGLWRWLAILEQEAHFGGFGVWVGALAALVVRTLREPHNRTALHRCSLWAAVALGTTALIGVLRAADDIGAWAGLLSTEFGALVVLKTGLALLLALLGAATRHLVLSQGLTQTRRLYRIIGAELIVVIGALAATAVLTGLSPPNTLPRSELRIRPPGAASYAVSLTGGRTLTVLLDPGSPGLNALHMTFTDATGREVEIARVSEMTIGPLGQPPSAVPLLQEGPGHFFGDVEISRGDWQLSVTATTRGGDVLHGRLAIRL